MHNKYSVSLGTSLHATVHILHRSYTRRGSFHLCPHNTRSVQKVSDFFLHHDNAPAHSAHVIQDFLVKNGMPLVRQAPYSPDLAPCDFWLFLTLKTTLKVVSVMGGHHTKIVRGAKEHSGGAIPEDFPEVAEALGKMC